MNGTQAVEFTLTIRKRLETGLSNFSSVLTHNHFTQDLGLDFWCFELNLNIVNFIFLFLGIILHKTPKRFLNAVSIAAKGTSGIIIQFPFYAGIMGMMVGVS